MIISQFQSTRTGGAVPYFTYTGNYDIELIPTGWKVRFLSSGTLKMLEQAAVDVFLVGGGGSGCMNSKKQTVSPSPVIVAYSFGGGGGGGYTHTQKGLVLQSQARYEIVVGDPGESSSITPVDSSEWSGNSYSANGGNDGEEYYGGDGGSGGAQSGEYRVYGSSGAYYGGVKFRSGGGNGADGEISGQRAGQGQGTTTREFGDPGGKLYAAGGNTYFDQGDQVPIQENTGNGGHGGHKNFLSGATGIVIIRNMHG